MAFFPSTFFKSPFDFSGRLCLLHLIPWGVVDLLFTVSSPLSSVLFSSIVCLFSFFF